MKHVTLLVAMLALLCGGLLPQLEVFGPTVIAPVYAGPAPVVLKERMPNAIGAVLVEEREEMCAGASLTVREYNRRGDGSKNDDLWLLFAPKSKKPFAAVEWEAPRYMWPEKFYMDLDLNGYADVVRDGDGGEEFGGDPCDTYMYYLSHKKP